MAILPIQTEVAWGALRVEKEDDGRATLQWRDSKTGRTVGLHTFTGEVERMEISEDQPDANTRNYEIVVGGARTGEERKAGAGNTTDIHVYGCGQKGPLTDNTAFERTGERVCAALDRFGDRIDALERSLLNSAPSAPGADAFGREPVPSTAAAPPLQEVLESVNAMRRELAEMARQMTGSRVDNSVRAEHAPQGTGVADTYPDLRERLGAIEETIDRFQRVVPPGSARATDGAGPILPTELPGLTDPMLEEMRSTRQEVAALTQVLGALHADQMRAIRDGFVQFGDLRERLGNIEDALLRLEHIAAPGRDRAASDPELSSFSGTPELETPREELNDDAGLGETVDRLMRDLHGTAVRRDELEGLLVDLAKSRSSGINGEPSFTRDELAGAAGLVVEALQDLRRVACESGETDEAGEEEEMGQTQGTQGTQGTHETHEADEADTAPALENEVTNPEPLPMQAATQPKLLRQFVGGKVGELVLKSLDDRVPVFGPVSG